MAISKISSTTGQPHSPIDQVRTALENDWIVPHYQPKVCLKTNKIKGFEALLRWSLGDHHLRMPFEIAAAFEHPEIAPLITSRLLRIIVSDCTRWQSEGVEFGTISLNVTNADFTIGDMAERFLRIMGQQLAPEILEIEVTESVLVGGQSRETLEQFNCLKSAGFNIAFDDFGTGYASLSDLELYPVDVIKIDQRFVRQLPHVGRTGTAIVNTILRLSDDLGIETVAEGVESRDQLNYLKEHGCVYAQGHYYSQAVPSESIPAMLEAKFDN
jgi:EAL domain-containing protein (putative c-di-GMP-specific phosphodiesterase class I)